MHGRRHRESRGRGHPLNFRTWYRCSKQGLNSAIFRSFIPLAPLIKIFLPTLLVPWYIDFPLPLDKFKFNLPIPEQKDYDVISCGVARKKHGEREGNDVTFNDVILPVAKLRYLCCGATFFCVPPIKALRCRRCNNI